MYVAVPLRGVSRVTMVLEQMEPVAARANVIPITKVADGFADVPPPREGHVVRVPYQMAVVARRLLHANHDAR